MDFLLDQQIFYTSKKYEPIYILLNSEYEIKYQELFMICATIGFRFNLTEEVVEKGREFRSNYFDLQQRTAIYTIVLCDSELGKKVEKFSEKDFILACRKRLEQYAEGGMTYLSENLFRNKWVPPVLDATYKNYDVDLVKFVLEKSIEVPF